MKSILLKNIPIYLVCYIFPLISIPFLLQGYDRIDYEIVWIVLFFISALCMNRMIKKNVFVILLCLFFAVLFKYICPLIVQYNQVYFRALMIDGKWIVYLVLTLLWVNNIGYPSEKVLYKAGVFFSKIFIMYSIYCYCKFGFDARPGVLGEANYDGLLMLIPFCFIEDMGGKFKDYFLFFIAVLCTGSRTGVIAILLLILMILKSKHPKSIILFLPIVVSLIIAIFIFRNYSSMENIDRYVFFYQAIVFFFDSDLKTFLFGVYPGIGMDITIINGFNWVVNVFEDSNDIVGVFPFYFHATYIRMALTWGVPFLIIALFSVLTCFFRVKYLPLKLIILILLLYSFTLSVLTLTNMSIMFFLSVFMMIRINRSLNN